MRVIQLVRTSRLRLVAGCLALCVQLALGVLAGAEVAGSGADVSDRELEAWVARRVADWQPTADERRFDQIGWTDDIRDAQRLAREHRRPVFLFTYDGRSIALKRC